METILEKLNELMIGEALCPLCNEILNSKQFLKTLPCYHLFHVDCLFHHFEHFNHKCPICQSEQPVEFYDEYFTTLGICGNHPKYIHFGFPDTTL